MTKIDFDQMYCGAIRRGDIVIFESDGREEVVLVLQDDILSQGLPTIIAAEIQPHRAGDEIMATEVLLNKKESGLGAPAVCRLHRLHTIDRRLVRAKKGEVEQKRMLEAWQALDNTLGRFRDGR